MLVTVAAIASAIVALSYVALVVAIGLLDPQQFAQAALRYWVGDMIGITVVTPFLLVLFTRRRIRVLSWELLAPLAVLLGSPVARDGCIRAFASSFSICSSCR